MILSVRYSYSLVLLAFIGVSSCNQNSELEKEINRINFNVNVERFDKLFMESNKDEFYSYKNDFPFLFPNNIPDSILLQRKDDSIQKLIKSSVDSVFSDFSSIEDDLLSLFKHIKYYNPSLEKPRLITVFSDVDYRNKVIVTDTVVLIGIDNYLGSEHSFYQNFHYYIRKNLEKDQIVVDLADEYATKMINQPIRNTFLDELIYQGKKMYLKDLWLPKRNDYSKIGYSIDELNWANENEYYIWEYFVKNEILYSTDPKLYDRFIAKGPFSRFYLTLDNESPSSIGIYIGWKIIKSFMNNNDIPLINMIRYDSQFIFKNAKFKPPK